MFYMFSFTVIIIITIIGYFNLLRGSVYNIRDILFRINILEICLTIFFH
jgi:hypothetical protein